MVKLWGHYAKWNAQVKHTHTHPTKQILYNSTYVRCLDSQTKGAESQTLIAVGLQNGVLLFNGYRVSVLQDEKNLEIDHDDGCTMWIHPIPLKDTLKND